ncbi:MAG: ankyrin repeat domain-containing protein [Pseudomonadales bacterium]
MPRHLRWLSGSALAFTVLTQAVLLFGPQEGLETLAGGLLAYFCFLYHLLIAPFFVVHGIRTRRFTPGFVMMSLYLLGIVGTGLYQVVRVNDLDDAARDLLEAHAEPESWRVRELGHTLYLRYKTGQPIPETERIEWLSLAERAEHLNRRDGRHMPALWYAAAMGDVEMVSRLLAAGAVADDPQFFATPPLAAAIEEGHIAAVRALLEGGADPDTGINRHYPALSLAAREEHLDIVEVLLDAGADPNLGDPTPFAVALAGSRSDMVSVLLDAGADPVPVRGELPLAFALAQEDAALIEVLLAKTEGFEQFSESQPPLLFQATSRCDLPAFQRYLHMGADPDVADRNGRPLFFHVALLRTRGCDLDAVRSEMVRTLIDAGARLDLEDERGVSLLLLALRDGQADVAAALVAAGADIRGEVNFRDFLMLSAAAGRNDLVRLAVGAGFDPNRWSEGLNRSNALHEAARAGQVDTVRLLIALGARLPEVEIDQRNLFRFAGEHPSALEPLLELHQQSPDVARAKVIRRAVTDSNNAASIALIDDLGIR